MNTKQLLQNLLKLQALEFGEAGLGETAGKETKKQIAELRVQIPLPILNHYDRMRVRGKKGASEVRNRICTGCHVQVTKSTVINLMHGEDIQICDNCGRYLYLPQPIESGLSAVPPPEKPGAKSRKQRELTCAA